MFTKKNQSAPVEPANDGLWQGNPHYKGVTNSWERGRDFFELAIRRKAETETQFLLGCVSTPPLRLPGFKGWMPAEQSTASEQEES